MGVFIETNSNDAALQRAKLESIYQIVRENASAEYDEHSLLKLLEYP